MTSSANQITRQSFDLNWNKTNSQCKRGGRGCLDILSIGSHLKVNKLLDQEFFHRRFCSIMIQSYLIFDHKTNVQTHVRRKLYY